MWVDCPICTRHIRLLETGIPATHTPADDPYGQPCPTRAPVAEIPGGALGPHPDQAGAA